MRILLDTHSLIWLSAGIKLGPTTLTYLREADSVLVSTLSILELRLKQANGKFPEAEEVVSNIKTMGLEVLDLTQSQTKGYKIFSPNNKDPYDNALITIAINQSMSLVTADKKILDLDTLGLVTVDAQK